MEPLKARVTPQMVALLGDMVARGVPGFDRASFVAAASDGLDALELTPRVAHIAAALRARLADDPAVLCGQLVRSLAPPEGPEDGGWFLYWPMLTVVERFAVDAPDAALPALREMTRHASAEFAIRPFIRHHPEATWRALRQWAADPDPRVRRLVSEGTRPRLPWACRLSELIADPAPALALLELLYEDDDEVVRRSVANHLNDVAKDHPDVAVAVAGRWSQAGGPATERLVRHALRTLIKAGHPGALAILGYGAPKAVTATLAVGPPVLVLGGNLRLQATLTSACAQPVLVDFRIHHQKQSGTTSPKVFKWTRARVAAGSPLSLTKRHAIRPISTRRYYPGTHRVELLVNGQALAEAAFELVLDVPTDPQK